MRRLGLLGGMSWESTLLYYRLINEFSREALGGLHSAPCLIHSLDFAQIAAWQAQGRWDECGQVLGHMAAQLESIGAAGIVLCTNTMHKVADSITSKIGIPLLHIIDATGRSLQASGVSRALLLATRYTMEDPFYRNYLQQKFGIEILVPNPQHRSALQSIIYDELCRGIIVADSLKSCLDMIAEAQGAGAEGVILGCTEITLLLQSKHTDLPLFDSTDLHARYAVEWALRQE